ncbi:MAG: hypothetical protein IPL61_34195 [Myxococcales bacterium]|nr:hypothetical protein [Myxococcales bacterium]
MGDGYSRSPKLLKGAIVQFVKMPIIPIPNIIIFQYNPDTLQRTLTPYAPPEPTARPAGETPPSTTPAEPTAQPFDPSESFNVSLVLDASDALETPERHPIAFVTGVADRIAALEMLLYPVGDSLLGGLVGSLNVSISGGAISASLQKSAARPEVPVTLFIWGPGRIVPVRLTTFNVEEQQWNQLLYPTRAKVTVGMKVITKDALAASSPETDDAAKKIARFCYDFTRAQKELLALANIANTVEAVAGVASVLGGAVGL